MLDMVQLFLELVLPPCEAPNDDNNGGKYSSYHNNQNTHSCDQRCLVKGRSTDDANYL